MSVRVAVLYFASLRDAAGCGREHHGFALPRERLRVAIGDAFVDWSTAPAEGAEIAFIPPVSGG